MRKLIVIASGLASFSVAAMIVVGVATPTWALTNPTAKCTLNGVSTGTLAGHLNSTNANSNELDYGGECGTVQVRLKYRLTASGPIYSTSWYFGAQTAWTNNYPYTSTGEHDSTRSALVPSWW